MVFLYVCKMLLAAWFNSRPLQGRGCFSLLSSGSTDAKQSRAPTQDRVINKYHLSVMRKRIVSSGCSTTKLKRITFRSSINKSLVNPNCKWRQTSDVMMNSTFSFQSMSAIETLMSCFCCGYYIRLYRCRNNRVCDIDLLINFTNELFLISYKIVFVSFQQYGVL